MKNQASKKLAVVAGSEADPTPSFTQQVQGLSLVHALKSHANGARTGRLRSCNTGQAESCSRLRIPFRPVIRPLEAELADPATVERDDHSTALQRVATLDGVP